MDVNTIYEWIIAVLPALTAVVSVITVAAKMLNKFAALREDVSNMTAREDIRNQLKEVLQENAKLKKQLNETLTKIDKVHRE